MTEHPGDINDTETRFKMGLPDKDGVVFFDSRNIIRCQSENSYTEFYIREENSHKKEINKILVSKGFGHFEEFLLSKGFFYRVHNQHIVNVNHIKRYIKNNGGYLVMDDTHEVLIPVARARKDEFLAFLKAKGIIL